MNKKVIIISTSLRNNSNSDKMAQEFFKGAEDGGNIVEMINLSNKTIGFCKGCLACQLHHKCIIEDDAIEIAEKVKEADVVVFASPIYYYEMSGQMKTLLDRMNSLYGSDYKFTDIYMLTCAAENGPSVCERAVNGLEGWIECFERASLKGTLFAGGVTKPNDILNHEALKKAYIMGKQI